MIISNLKKLTLVAMSFLITSSGAWASSAFIAVQAPNVSVANFFDQHIGHYIQKNNNGSYEVSCKAIKRIDANQLIALSGTYQVNAANVTRELTRAKDKCSRI